MSIRLRLSLLYSLILAAVALLFGLALYSIQAQTMLDWLKQDLSVSGATLEQSVLHTYLDVRPAQPGAQPASPAPSFSSDPAFQRVSESEIVRVLSPDGTLIASPQGASDTTLPLSAAGKQAVSAQKDWWEISSDTGRRILVYNHPVVYQQRIISILQVGRPLSEHDQSLQMLANTLAATVLVTTLISLGLGWLLSGFALRPIQRITQTAQGIGAERDFTRRVVYSGPPDEVGQLASTFNGMLAQLEEAYLKTAHALEMQRSFVADVSHELRTPLTTLRGNLGLLARTPPVPAEEQADILADMVDENDRLIRLVNDLLVLARADTGRSLARETVEILPLFDEICRQARQLAPQRQVSFSAAAGIRLNGDRDALKQVLLILVDNALKHSSGDIQLNAETDSARVVLQVSDHGTGIPPEKLAHVFERFYKASEAQSVPGFGLGLPIARALVEGQGGTIKMTSAVGKGSTVSLSFPDGA